MVNVNAQNSINVFKRKSKLELNLNLLYSFISLFSLSKRNSSSTNVHIPSVVILCSIYFYILSKILIIFLLFILTTKYL